MLLIDVPPTPSDDEARAYCAKVRADTGKITVDDVVRFAETSGARFYPLLARLEAMGIIKRGIGRALRSQGFDPRWPA